MLCCPLVTICDLNGRGAGGGEGGGEGGEGGEGKGRGRDKGKGEEEEGDIKREEWKSSGAGVTELNLTTCSVTDLLALTLGSSGTPR